MGNLGEYVILYLAAFMLSVFLVPVVRRLALKVGAIDEPDGMRKIHTHAVPRMGGVAIFIAFIVPVVSAYVVGWLWLPESQVFQIFQQQLTRVGGLLGASLLILLLGIYDDIHHVRPRVKVLVQIVAALILCAVGIRIDRIGNPFTGELIQFGWLAWPITVFWLLAITNAINLIDGMDGLGPGVGLFVAGTMFLISLYVGVALVSAVMAALVGAIIGFLIFNFHPAKIFMGDSGSLFVGFLLAAIAIQGSVKRHMMIPIIALALPIVDTFMAVVRRWSKGLPISVADKQHVHHRLIKMGFTQRETLLMLYGVSVILGCAALVIAFLDNTVAVGIAAGMIVAILVAVYAFAGGEVMAIGSQIVQAWRRRQRRREAWTQVYKTTAKMENAANLEQMWEDIGELFGELGLDMGHVSLADVGGVLGTYDWWRGTDPPELTSGGGMLHGWTVKLPLEQNGRICGELMLGKDSQRGPLPGGLPEMVDVLRGEIVKTLTRLNVLPEVSGEEPGAARASGEIVREVSR